MVSSHAPKIHVHCGLFVLQSDCDRFWPLSGGAFPEVFVVNLMISSQEYDFHSLVKVAEMAGLAGVVSFHPAGDDYLVTFPDIKEAPEMVADFRARLRGLEHNIWNF